MKMVKSLLLGAAAGFVAVAGAQAADLPVKAKPVQYVKICSLYGAGFWYIPGTDTCIKIGGYARAEWDMNANGSFNPQTGQNYNRGQNEYVTRNRFLTTLDVRSQTAYGTLRGYTRFGVQWTTGDAITGGSGAVLYVDRAFVQLGGWTFGKTESFFNFSTSDFGYTNNTQLLWNDTGGSGVPVLAYTASFGNGLSATIALEDHFENQGPIAGVTVGSFGSAAAGGVPLAGGLVNAAQAAGAGPITAGMAAGNVGTGGTTVPDLVANFRVDQAWGSAQIEGALANLHAAYYTPTALFPSTIGHPGDKLGGAIGAGIKINLPMLGKGDSIGIAGTWCDGATHYCSNNGATVNGGPGDSRLFAMTRGGVTGLGQLYDAYYNNTGTLAQPQGNLEKARAWNVNGGIQHRWNDMWATSLWGAYLNYKARSTAVDASCLLTPTGAIVGGTFVATGFQGAGCLDFSAWQAGSRTLWNPVVNLDISVEAMYTKVNTALNGSSAFGTGVVGNVPGLYGNTNVWSGILRFQRNFWP